MNKRLTLIMLALLLAFVPAAVAQTTYEQLTSIADIDESALYVLGVDEIGFHYSGTSSWGNVALPSEETPIYYIYPVQGAGRHLVHGTGYHRGRDIIPENCELQ